VELIANKPIGAMGRLVIPEIIRERHNLKQGSVLDIYVDGESIVLKPHKKPPQLNNCCVCEKVYASLIVQGQLFCTRCAENLLKEIQTALEKE